MALDVFLRILASKSLNNEFTPLCASKSGPKIPALAFADDCIIFSTADMKSISVIKQCLDDLCHISEQSLNHGKSALYFAPSTSAYLRQQVKCILNVKSAKGPSKYLGMPLINGRVTKHLFNDLISKIDAKLNVWYIRFLSMAGKTVLLNSTLQSMPFYSMAAKLYLKIFSMKLTAKCSIFC